MSICLSLDERDIEIKAQTHKCTGTNAQVNMEVHMHTHMQTDPNLKFGSCQAQIFSNMKASKFVFFLGFWGGFWLCVTLQLQICVISMVYPGITACVIIRLLQIPCF